MHNKKKMIRYASYIVLAAFVVVPLITGGAWKSPIIQPVKPASLERGAGWSRPSISIIRQAAARNNCYGENYEILLAIYQSEKGGPGKEFGIKHPRAWGTDLDTQAGWAAATVVKNRQRWLDAGEPCDFITFLARRYCPLSVDPVGHRNWIKNVSYFAAEFNKIAEGA